jgi:hypothetical protein
MQLSGFPRNFSIPMDRVFISSIQSGFEDVREAVRAATESLGKLPIMAEGTGASADPSKRTLLDRVAEADVFLLLIGPRYGKRGESGFSPTEDEFNEARRLTKPILVLIQEGERDAEQEEFIRRVRGTWEQGHFAPTFRDASDVGLLVVRSLSQMAANATTQTVTLPMAQQRAMELAEGDRRDRGGGSGSKARVVFAPLVRAKLLDAVTLDTPGLVEQVATAARASGLITHAMGLTIDVRADGIRMTGKDPQAWGEANLFVGVDGAVVGEGDVAGTGSFSSMQVVEERLVEVVERSCQFAEGVWRVIDAQQEVRQVCVTVAIPDASNKVFTTAPVGNRMSMSMSLGPVVMAPQPPVQVRREDSGSSATVRRLVASVKRVFQDANAVHPR